MARHSATVTDSPPLEGEVLELAADQRPGGAPEQVGGRRAGRRRRVEHHLERQRLQRAAGEDRRGHAEDRPDRAPVPALQVAVHHVVVHEREVVQQLDRDRAGQPDLGRRAGGPRGQQRQPGPHRPCRRR